MNNIGDSRAGAWCDAGERFYCSSKAQMEDNLAKVSQDQKLYHNSAAKLQAASVQA